MDSKQEQGQKVKDLLQQLQQAGAEVKQVLSNSEVEKVQDSSKILESLSSKLTSNEPAAWDAWVAWTKSF